MTRPGGARRYAALLAPTLVLGGCATFVTSKPAGGDETGIEYALCLPVLIAEPQPNGLVKFTPGCLPDPEHRYVVRGKTLFGKLTLEVTRNPDMTLDKVTIDRDGSAAAVEAVKATGAIRQKQLEVSAEAEKQRRVAEKAALDAAKKSADDAANAVKTAEANVVQARIALDHEHRKLQSLLQVLDRADSTAQEVLRDPNEQSDVRMAVRTAMLAIDEKQAAYDLATLALFDAERAAAAAQTRLRQTASSGNVPAPDGPTIWGPLVYAIKQEVDAEGRLSVSLDALFEQPELGTAAPVTRAAAAANGVDETAISVAPDANTGIHVFAIALRDKADEIAGILMQSVDNTSYRTRPQASLSPDGQKISVTVTPDTAPGLYTLILVVKNGDQEREFHQTVSLTGPEPAG